ncbi:MAG: FlgD immunoglobulin-like domain containing protein [Candidatus Eisenbacteria bacterium]
MRLRSTTRLLGLLTLTLLVPHASRAAWSEPTNLGSAINTSSDEYGATLNGDGTVLIFDSNKPGGMGRQDLYKSIWNGAAWGLPTSLGSGVNTTGVDYAPSLTGDGNTLYLTGNDWDLYTSTAVAGVFGARTKVTQLSTVGSEEWAPGVSNDGTTMIFTARIRPGGLGGHDIWISQKVLGVWQAPTNIGAPINTTGDEYAGSLDASGTRLYFSRGGDLFVSEKIAGAWQTPVALDGLVNSDYYETHPVISADGTTLYFGSERPGGFGGYDIWSSTLLNGADTPADPRLPTQLALVLNGPNPTTGRAGLRLALPAREAVEISVYALSGRRVANLFAGELSPGFHPVSFEGRDGAGNRLPSGAYLVRASGKNWSLVQKLLLLH